MKRKFSLKKTVLTLTKLGCILLILHDFINVFILWKTFTWFGLITFFIAIMFTSVLFIKDDVYE